MTRIIIYMYAITHSFNHGAKADEICDVEVGLSKGIPIIKYFGNVSQEYRRSKDKIQFLFPYLGRKISNRKIRVNISSKETVNDPNIDLAIVTAVYLAFHDIEIDGVYAYGRVDMKGDVRSNVNLPHFLFLVEQLASKHKILFTSVDSIDLQALYPSIKIVPVSNVLQIFRYFEGDWEPKEKEDKRSERKPRKTVLNNMTSFLILFTLLKGKFLYISDRSNDEDLEIIRDLPTDVIPEKIQIGIDRINALFSPNRNDLPFILINSQDQLTALDQRWPGLNEDTPLLFDLRNEPRKSLISVLGYISTAKPTNYLIVTQECECAKTVKTEGGCICNSRAKDEWKALLREITSKVEYAHYKNAPKNCLLSKKEFESLEMDPKRQREIKSRLSENKVCLADIL